MVSGLQIEVSKAVEILFPCTVGEDSFTEIVDLAIIEAFAVEVLAADLAAVIYIAVTADHKVLGDMFDACL